jgi:hypothetical protein
MTWEQALQDIQQGNPIQCTKEEWREIRPYVQAQAATEIDSGQVIYAIIKLEEVKRLDAKFGNPFEEVPDARVDVGTDTVA